MKLSIIRISFLLIWAFGGQAQENKLSSKQIKDTLKVFRYLALGDSYTIGTGIGKENSYASLLAAHLATADAFDSVYLNIIAENGWTTANLQQGISKQAPDSNYHLVTLLIGVNNQYEKRSQNEYRNQLDSLLKKAIALAQNNKDHVLVLSIPDWGSTPSGESSRAAIATEIDAFNTLKKERCHALGLAYVNLTDISRTAVNQPLLVASDSLHFSAEMHQLWLTHLLKEFSPLQD
jgi:lysophospholipase L1-like esterase